MKSVSLSSIVQGLKEVGLKHGDIVMVHSQLHAIGYVEGVPVADIPEIYLRAFDEVVGDEGTIVVPTYTTSFGRFATPFNLETTPSESGVFSEHVRMSKGAVRTLHPIQSLAALGSQAQTLGGDHPCWNVGHDTIWDRMHRKGAKVVALGISLAKTMSFMHQVEFLACVPYLYQKILQGEVSAGGKRVIHDFYMAVRYLNYGISNDLSRLDADLNDLGAIKLAPLGGDWVSSVTMEAAFEVGMKGLRNDPYYLLQNPPLFVNGEIPWDGSTIEREKTAPQYFLAG